MPPRKGPAWSLPLSFFTRGLLTTKARTFWMRMLTLNMSALPHTGQSGRRLLLFPEIPPTWALICAVSLFPCQSQQAVPEALAIQASPESGGRLLTKGQRCWSRMPTMNNVEGLTGAVIFKGKLDWQERPCQDSLGLGLHSGDGGVSSLPGFHPQHCQSCHKQTNW